MIVAGALAMLLVLGAEPAHFSWPKPALIEEIEIPGVVQSDGVPVRLHQFRSKLGVQELLQAFATAFDQAGFYVATKQERVVAEPHLTALDWRTKISYSAILSPNADGTTTCLLGEAALGKRRAPTAAGDFAPLMPGAVSVARIDQEADRLISFSVQSDLEAVQKFYREKLPALGFAATEEAGAYARGAEQIRLITRTRPRGVISAVLAYRRGER